MKAQDIDIQITITGTFLRGQYELYKQKFIDTDNADYLENMNDMHKAMILFQFMQKTISRLANEKRELKEEIEKLNS